MTRLKIFTIIALITLLSVSAFAQPIRWVEPPVVHQANFLRMPGALECNIDWALSHTDSAAALFLEPVDAVVLHVDLLGQMKDIFIISDAAMNRLTIWQLSSPDNAGYRTLENMTAYHGDDTGTLLKHPAGMATNAVNRQFDPLNDVFYVADRANDRILELAFDPDLNGGKLRCNRIIGAGYLEYPYDIAISAYGDGNPTKVDLYVAEWGRDGMEDGSLKRFSLAGTFEGSWHDIKIAPYPQVALALKRPLSVACFPDTIAGSTAIYIAESSRNTLAYLAATTDSEPDFRSNYNLHGAYGSRLTGGIALDDHGRPYVANEPKGMIEFFGQYLDYVYGDDIGHFGSLGEDVGQFYYPTNIILDTFYGECEALILECYGRKSGLQTYIIEGAALSTKANLGFSTTGLVRPQASPSHGVLPGEFKLSEAYPNPFNSSCLISFAMPEQAKVKIEVFNILGQKVTTLLDETRDAGEHSVVFDASKLSSGIYYYKLSMGNLSDIKSMLLLK